MKFSFQFCSRILALSGLCALPLSSCATISSDNQTDAHSDAEALAARIQAASSIFESAGAMTNLSGTSPTTARRFVRTTYPSVYIKNGGSLHIKSVKVDEDKSESRKNLPPTVITCDLSLSLSKIRKINVATSYLESQGKGNVVVSEDFGIKHAELILKNSYTVSVDLDARNFGLYKFNWGSTLEDSTTKSNSSIGIIELNDKNDAISFARDLQDLVAKYRGGQVPILNL